MTNLGDLGGFSRLGWVSVLGYEHGLGRFDNDDSISLSGVEEDRQEDPTFVSNDEKGTRVLSRLARGQTRFRENQDGGEQCGLTCFFPYTLLSFAERQKNFCPAARIPLAWAPSGFEKVLTIADCSSGES